MPWEIKNSQTAVEWPIGRNIIEAIKTIMCGWYEAHF